MKNICCCILLMFATSTSAYALDVGIGLSIQSHDSSIYIPIKISERFRLEVVWRHLDNNRSEGNEIDDFEATELGIGLFRLYNPIQFTQFYYGIGITYVKNERTVLLQTSTTILNSDGYRILPAIGFEYFFSENISLGGDLGFFIENVDGDATRSGTRLESENKTKGTTTRAILRYYFK